MTGQARASTRAPLLATNRKTHHSPRNLCTLPPLAPAVTSQYRKGAPSGFAVLRYKGAPPGLPAEPAPQPEEVQAKAWDVKTHMSVRDCSLHALCSWPVRIISACTLAFCACVCA